MPTTTSADPDDLVRYVEATADGTSRLRPATADLRAALDAFRASEGRATFLADVPEVDLDLTFLALRWQRLATWLDGVARAFATADGGDRGLATLADAALDEGAGRWVAAELESIRRDGRLILDTGTGDDHVMIDDRGDRIVVWVNGAVYTFPTAEGGAVVVRLGQGDDQAAPIPSLFPGDRPTRDGLLIDGGRGDDRMRVRGGAAVLHGDAGDDVLVGSDGADVLLGGVGDDSIDGYGGADHILGGAGEDLLYGETGDDAIDGGDGRDHVDGGAGADRVAGGEAADVLSGGEGDDVVDGGAGDDVAFTGPGADIAIGGRGADDLHVERGDLVTDRGGDDIVERRTVDLTRVDEVGIDVDGPLADRIRSDLVTLASTVAGSHLLEELRDRFVRIVSDVGDSHKQGVVSYDPTGDEAGFGPVGPEQSPFDLSYSPLVTLHHELVHAYDHESGDVVDGVYLGPDAAQSGRVRVDVDGGGLLGDDGRLDPRDRWVVVDADGDGVVTVAEIEAVGGPDLNGDGVVDRADGWAPNRERDAVGLPVDHDEDPSTPHVPGAQAGGHPGWMNENALRTELGLDSRGRY